MKKISLHSEFTVFPDMESLPPEISALMKGAVEARGKAYAPYSNFYVGAAVLLEDGEVVYGNNQENAAFPSGLCAERVAIFQAGAAFPGKKIRAVAITAASEMRQVKEPIPPCGACRQVLAEYEFKQGAPLEVYFMGDNTEIYRAASIQELLPLIFTRDSLRRK